MSENILEIRSLSKKYTGFALKGASFALPYGYIMGLIGPNGSGKTTLIRLIMNLLLKESGDILLFGKDHQQHEAYVKSRIGFVYDQPPFNPMLRLETIKRSIAPFYNEWDEEKYRDLYQRFDLPNKRTFKKLSTGMKMKFSLAIALSHNADLILMDEPTSGLDPVFRRELLEILTELIKDENKSVLFSTHITSDLERVADYITYIENGTIGFSCSRQELIDSWGVVKTSQERLSHFSGAIYRGHRTTKFGCDILTSDKSATLAALIDDETIEGASLEDIMFLMHKGGSNA